MQAEPITIRHRNVTREASHVLSYSNWFDSKPNINSQKERLDRFGGKKETSDELSRSVRAIEEDLERFEQIAFDVDDVLDDKELEKLNEIVIALIYNLIAIIPLLDSTITEGPLHSSERLFAYLIRSRLINSFVAQLNSLLLKIIHRLEIKILQQPLNYGYQEFEEIVRGLGQWTESSNCHESEDIWSLPIGCSGISYEIASLPPRCVSLDAPRPCLLIMFFFATFIGLSCFLGVYFTLNKNYGYSMGDAFTLAGWVVAVGAFVSTAVLAYHYPRCECWEPPKHRQRSRRGSYEMANLAELPG